MTPSRLVHCTFPKSLIQQPLLYNLGADFGVVPNIRGATINDEIGLVYLELQGDDEDVAKALEYLVSRGVTIEPVENDAPSMADGDVEI